MHQPFTNHSSFISKESCKKVLSITSVVRCVGCKSASRMCFAKSFTWHFGDRSMTVDVSLFVAHIMLLQGSLWNWSFSKNTVTVETYREIFRETCRNRKVVNPVPPQSSLLQSVSEWGCRTSSNSPHPSLTADAYHACLHSHGFDPNDQSTAPLCSSESCCPVVHQLSRRHSTSVLAWFTASQCSEGLHDLILILHNLTWQIRNHSLSCQPVNVSIARYIYYIIKLYCLTCCSKQFFSASAWTFGKQNPESCAGWISARHPTTWSKESKDPQPGKGKKQRYDDMMRSRALERLEDTVSGSIWKYLEVSGKAQSLIEVKNSE